MVPLDVPELATGLHGGRETDGVVEGDAEGLVRVLAALGTVEEVLLDVVADGEERAARRVGRGVLAVGAGDAARERSWKGR